jgi:predicted FMN-binding regulatory protein PaiB
MYVPAHFEETRLEVLHDLVRSHPLATVVTLDSGLNANHSHGFDRDHSLWGLSVAMSRASQWGIF